MFGLGTWEIALILGVALVVLGPDQLPSVARKMGRGLRDLRRAANDFTREIQSAEVEVTRAFDPPEGQEAREDGNDNLPASSAEDPSAADNNMADESEDPPDAQAQPENQATDSGPYADLYDPRAHREHVGESTSSASRPDTEPSGHGVDEVVVDKPKRDSSSS
jgi:sec-independent protein translocase protein TatB